MRCNTGNLMEKNATAIMRYAKQDSKQYKTLTAYFRQGSNEWFHTGVESINVALHNLRKAKAPFEMKMYCNGVTWQHTNPNRYYAYKPAVIRGITGDKDAMYFLRFCVPNDTIISVNCKDKKYGTCEVSIQKDNYNSYCLEVNYPHFSTMSEQCAFVTVPGDFSDLPLETLDKALSIVKQYREELMGVAFKCYGYSLPKVYRVCSMLNPNTHEVKSIVTEVYCQTPVNKKPLHTSDRGVLYEILDFSVKADADRYRQQRFAELKKIC